MRVGVTLSSKKDLLRTKIGVCLEGIESRPKDIVGGWTSGTESREGRGVCFCCFYTVVLGRKIIYLEKFGE